MAGTDGAAAAATPWHRLEELEVRMVTMTEENRQLRLAANRAAAAADQVASAAPHLRQMAERAAAAASRADAAAQAAAADDPMPQTDGARQFVAPGRAPAAYPAVDTRVLGRPDRFDGREASWKGWSVVARAYAGAVSPRLLSLLAAAEDADVEEVGLANLQATDDKKLCSQWYFVLAMLLTGRSQEKLHIVLPGEGLRLWRMLVREYEPKVVARRAGLLQSLLGHKFEGDDVVQAMERFEGLVAQYEAAGGSGIDDEMKSAIVVRNLSRDRELGRHLLLNSRRLDTYDKMREEVIEIRRMGVYCGTSPAPVELDLLNRPKSGERGRLRRPGGRGSPDCGKGKSGGRGGGTAAPSDGWRSRGAPADKAAKRCDGYCSYCGRRGHRRRECWKLDEDRGNVRELDADEVDEPGEGGETGTRGLDGLEISGLEPEVCVGVDSGSAISTWPARSHGEYEAPPAAGPKSGATYRGAGRGSAPIRGLGARAFSVLAGGHRRTLRTRVAEVRKPFLAVSGLTQAGHDVVSEAGDGMAHAHRVGGGRRHTSSGRNSVYEWPTERPGRSDGSEQGPWLYPVGADIALPPGLGQPRGDAAQTPANSEADEGRREELAQEMETTPATGLLSPDELISRELEAHQPSQCPYRPWGRACVAGREKTRERCGLGGAAARGDWAGLTVSLDYGFMGGARDGDMAKESGTLIPIVRDWRPGWADAIPMPPRGVHPFAIRALARCIDAAGYPKLVPRSDGEHAITALKAAAVEHLRGAQRSSSEAIMEESGTGELQAGGVAEGLVREATLLARNLISAVREMHGFRPGASHSMGAWAVHHAGRLLPCAQRNRADGRTGCERRYSQLHARALEPFGEPVMCAAALVKGARCKHEDRHLDGSAVSLADRTDKSLAATEDGVYAASSVKRVLTDRRSRAQQVGKAEGLPWAMVQPVGTTSPGSESCALVAPAVVAGADSPPKASEAKQTAAAAPSGGAGGVLGPRRARIRRDVELEGHGVTTRCAGCEAAMAGRTGNHTADCRARAEKCMGENPDERCRRRLETAARRRTQEGDADTAAPQAPPPPPPAPAPAPSPAQLSAVAAPDVGGGVGPLESDEGVDGSDPETGMDMGAIVVCQHCGPAVPCGSERAPMLGAAAGTVEAVDAASAGCRNDGVDQGTDDLPQAVTRARAEEVAWLPSFGVCGEVDASTVKDLPRIKARRVGPDRGGLQSVQTRSRLVTRGVHWRDSLLPRTSAAAPPWEAVKVALVAVVHRPGRVALALGVGRAPIHSLVARELVIEPPPEDPGPGEVRLLRRRVHGTRNAANRWERNGMSSMEGAVYAVGGCCPCLFACARTLGCAVIRGDDVGLAGSPERVQGGVSGPGKKMALKRKAMLGTGPDQDRSAALLGRPLTAEAVEHGPGDMQIVLEPDPWHADTALADLGLEGPRAEGEAKPVAVPAVKMKEGDDGDDEISAGEAKTSRSLAMRSTHVARDQPHLSFAVGKVFEDFDWAGDEKHRRSIAHVRVDWDGALVQAVSGTPRTRAPSSAGAEFSALVRATPTGLGAASTCRRLVLEVGAPIVFLDSEAARGLASHEGAGAIRHPHTPLWVQEVNRAGRRRFARVPGLANPADMGTHGLASPRPQQQLARCGFELRSGRKAIALEAQVA